MRKTPGPTRTLKIAAIAASIKEWGWTTPALVGEDGGLIAGHARILAARQLGIGEIPVMVAADWSEAQKRAYVAPTLPLSRRARPRASRRWKSKAVAGRQGRAVVDRSADPVCQKCTDPHGCPGRGNRGEHQGVGLDDAGAGGRGRWPDRGPCQDTRRPAARHRRDPGDGRRGVDRGAKARLRRL